MRVRRHERAEVMPLPLSALKLPAVLVLVGYLSFLAVLLALRQAVASLEGGELHLAAARLALAAFLVLVWLYLWRALARAFRNKFLKSRMKS